MIPFRSIKDLRRRNIKGPILFFNKADPSWLITAIFQYCQRQNGAGEAGGADFYAEQFHELFSRKPGDFFVIFSARVVQKQSGGSGAQSATRVLKFPRDDLAVFEIKVNDERVSAKRVFPRCFNIGIF